MHPIFLHLVPQRNSITNASVLSKFSHELDFKPTKSTFLFLSNTSLMPFMSASSTLTKPLCCPIACYLHCLLSTSMTMSSFSRSKLSSTPIVLITALNISLNGKAILNQIFPENLLPISKHNPISRNFISAILLNQTVIKVLGFNGFSFLVLQVLLLLASPSLAFRLYLPLIHLIYCFLSLFLFFPDRISYSSIFSTMTGFFGLTRGIYWFSLSLGLLICSLLSLMIYEPWLCSCFRLKFEDYGKASW